MAIHRLVVFLVLIFSVFFDILKFWNTRHIIVVDETDLSGFICKQYTIDPLADNSQECRDFLVAPTKGYYFGVLTEYGSE